MIVNWKKKIISYFCVFCLTVALSSCLPKTDTNSQEASSADPNSISLTDNKSQSEETTVDSELGKKSDTLRLYLKKRNSYNPLNTFDYSGRAVFQLLYRSLFQIDSQNILRCDLVKQAKYIQEKNLYEIELIAGNSFSNQELIDSADCRASILAYRDYLRQFLEGSVFMNEVTENENIDPDMAKNNQAENSAFQVGNISDENLSILLLKEELERLNQIEQINIIDEKKFEILLQSNWLSDSEEIPEQQLSCDNSDSDVLFALTMPVMKQEEVDNQNFPAFTSGNYHLVKNDEQGILLQAARPDMTLQNILLLEYAQVQSAIRALEDHQIDMIYLDEENFNLFGKQNNRKMISFPGQRYFYLQFGKNEMINMPEFQNALKQVWLIRDDLSEKMTGHHNSTNLPLPYNDAAISQFHLMKKTQGDPDIYAYFQKFDKDKIHIDFMVPDGVKEQEWAMQLRESLLNLNIDINIQVVAFELYQKALAEGKYDLALNWLDINHPMTLTKTFQSINPAAAKNIKPEEAAVICLLNQYFNTVDRQMDQKVLEDHADEIQTFISNYFDNLNILGIGFSKVGILMSNRVENVPDSYINNPYAHLEEIWVQH